MPAPRKKGIRGRDDEQREQRSEAHAADDDPADLCPRFAARSGGERERHGSQHHRARCHQDRAQPERCRIDDRVEQRLALGAQLVGEFDDQNPMLGDQPDERDQPHLAVNVERSSGQPQHEQRAGHRQRH